MESKLGSLALLSRSSASPRPSYPCASRGDCQLRGSCSLSNELAPPTERLLSTPALDIRNVCCSTTNSNGTTNLRSFWDGRRALLSAVPPRPNRSCCIYAAFSQISYVAYLINALPFPRPALDDPMLLGSFFGLAKTCRVAMLHRIPLVKTRDAAALLIMPRHIAPSRVRASSQRKGHGQLRSRSTSTRWRRRRSYTSASRSRSSIRPWGESLLVGIRSRTFSFPRMTDGPGASLVVLVKTNVRCVYFKEIFKLGEKQLQHRTLLQLRACFDRRLYGLAISRAGSRGATG